MWIYVIIRQSLNCRVWLIQVLNDGHELDKLTLRRQTPSKSFLAGSPSVCHIV